MRVPCRGIRATRIILMRRGEGWQMTSPSPTSLRWCWWRWRRRSLSKRLGQRRGQCRSFQGCPHLRVCRLGEGSQRRLDAQTPTPAPKSRRIRRPGGGLRLLQAGRGRECQELRWLRRLRRQAGRGRECQGFRRRRPLLLLLLQQDRGRECQGFCRFHSQHFLRKVCRPR